MGTQESSLWLWDVWRNEEIRICTPQKAPETKVLIHTVIQPDADLMTFLSTDGLASVLEKRELLQEHHEKLRQCIQTLRGFRVIVNCIPVSGITGAILLWQFIVK